MKKIFLYILFVFLASCEDDFLERMPLDSIHEGLFFKNSGDLRAYVNNFYSQLPLYSYQGTPNNLGLDANSDIVIVQDNITSSLDMAGNSGIAPFSSEDWKGRFDKIRNVNFFLTNYNKVNTRDIVSNQYIGEGYFFRAWNYFDFLVKYGDVPVYKKLLNVDDEELFKSRDSRYDVAKFIIQDLDSAIVNLSWKGQGSASAGRVNKESALILKARVALFEGSWEYYHGIKGTEFAVTGKDGKNFLELVEPTIQQLIDHQGSNIFMEGGPLSEPYNQLFAQKNGELTKGVFFYRVYTASLLETSHNFWNKVNDEGFGITKRLVDMYLDKDGLPQELSLKSFHSLNEKGQNLDPRFRQTIWTPDRGPMTQIVGRNSMGSQHLRYPVITDALGPSYPTATGFRNWKGAILDASENRAGEVDDIFIRYAEGLLAYAEAKAILGTINQTDIDKTVNVIRGRVGMSPLILTEIVSWNITYAATEGFEPSASNIVNEIRRERTVELALEGFRLMDIKRWAVFDKVINGYKPQGAQLDEFLEYFNNRETLANDGWQGTIDLTLILGNNVQMDYGGYINPYFRYTQFMEGGAGFYIDKDRDYLNPIPKGEIELYKEYGAILTQNPGWN